MLASSIESTASFNTNPFDINSNTIASGSAWTNLLQRISSGKVSSACPERHLVVMGPHSDKLTRKIRGLSGENEDIPVEHPSFLPIEYKYIPLLNQETSNIAGKLHIHTLNKLQHFSSFVDTIIHERNVGQSSILIGLSWTRPEDFARDLAFYLKLVHERILKRFRDTLLEGSSDYSPKKQSSVSPRKASPRKSPKKSDKLSTDQDSSDSIHLKECPFLPIHVMCMDSEKMGDFDAQLRDDQFDFLQQSLRAMLLPYNASLSYLPTHKQDVFHSWMSHILALSLQSSRVDSSQVAFKFGQPSSVTLSLAKKECALTERETIFLPNFWDSPTKICLLNETFPIQEMAPLITEEGVSFDGIVDRVTENIKIQKKTKQYVIPKLIEIEPEEVFLTKLQERLIEDDKVFEASRKDVSQSTLITNDRESISSSALTREVSQASALSSSTHRLPSEGSSDDPLLSAKARLQALAAASGINTSNPTSTTSSSTSNLSPKEALEQIAAKLGKHRRQSGIGLSASSTSSSLSSKTGLNASMTPSLSLSSLATTASAGSGTATNPATVNVAGASVNPPATQNEVLANFFSSLLQKKVSSSSSSSSPKSSSRASLSPVTSPTSK